MNRLLWAPLLLFPQVSALLIESSGESEWMSTEPHDLQRTYKIRIATLTCACLSVTASLVAFNWFYRIEKRFRHRLIMLLIYGDLTRATWFLIFAVISLARGTVKSELSFCQSSGFLIQYGTETSDYAVLVIAVHSALQVFNPSTLATSDGLYPYRRYVYAGALLVPCLMAGLAFVNPHRGYLSQGAYCTLPLRPFWYRLALAWIPRYTIALIIISLAIAIYNYVGFEFREYSNTRQSVTTSLTTMATRGSQGERDPEVAADTPAMTELELMCERRTSSIAQDIVASPRRVPSVTFSSAGPSLDHTTRSLPGSSLHLPLRCSVADRPPLSAIPSGDTVRPSTSTDALQLVVSPCAHDEHSIDISTIVGQEPSPLQQNTGSRSPSPTSAIQRLTECQHARIRRQLRLMFIYPLIYTLMWLLPFIQHCTTYQDKYVKHPIWFLRLGSQVCMASMGFVDCLIFSLREKPWRSIRTSDGTLWGSFAVWRRNGVTRNGSLLGGSIEGGIGGASTLQRTMSDSAPLRVKSISIRKSTSSNDYTMMTMERARARLELEREERLAAVRARIASLNNSADSLYEDDSASDYGRDGGQGCMLDERMAEMGAKGKGTERAVEV